MHPELTKGYANRFDIFSIFLGLQMQMEIKSKDALGRLAVLVSLLSLFLLSGCQQGHTQGASGRAAPEVGTVTIKPQRLVLTTKLPGRTSAHLVAEVRPQVNGILQKRLFTEGANVKEGQLLYQIDPAPFQAALASAKASLHKAETNLPSLGLRAERYNELLADNAVSKQDYDDAAAALEQAKAEIQFWRAEVKKARINLNYTRVVAPISGRIGKSNVTVGALVSAYQATQLATIQKMDPIYVDVVQSTAELLRLKRETNAGELCADEKNAKKVKIILEDGTPYPLDGLFKFRDVTVDPSTGTVTLRMVVPNPNGLLLPGMFVRAVIQEGIAENAILAPQQGVTRNPKGEPLALIVDEAGKVRQRSLTLGRAMGDKWLVKRGLAAGDRVIVEGAQKVRPGARSRLCLWMRKNKAVKPKPRRIRPPRPIEGGRRYVI